MNAFRLLTLAAALSGPLLQYSSANQSSFATIYTVNGTDPQGLTAASGALYVAALAGGSTNCGFIFELQPAGSEGDAWTEGTIYDFAAHTADGCDPGSAPAVGPDGNLYGTTQAGGANNQGAVYQLRPPTSPGGTWTESVLYSFTAQFSFPFRPIIGPGGVLYVGATRGGANGYGMLLELMPPPSPGSAWKPAAMSIWKSPSPSRRRRRKR